MNAVKKALKRVPVLYPAYQRVAYRLRYPQGRWGWDVRHWVSAWRVGGYHNRYQGKSCVIIGNGPSLNQMDLSQLRDKLTFGLNRGYMLFDRIGAPTSFLVCVNALVLEQFGADIARQPVPKFLSWAGRDVVPFTRDTAFIRTSGAIDFSHDARHLLYEGNTVTYVAMQLAYYMGFETVILIGVDHNFSDKGTPHTTVTTQEGDANHFDPNYFGKGIKWQLPDLEGSERAYALAKQVFEADGRRIIDATLGGKLHIFPKMSLEEALR